MPETQFPWDKPQTLPQDVQSFIDTYKPHLLQNQIELLEHFKDNIYGFHLQEHNTHEPSVSRNKNKGEAIFAFEHAGVKGKITLSF